MIPIALIEDEALFLNAFSFLIGKMRGYEVIIKATDGEDFLRQLENASRLPEIIISDIKMEPMDGFSCAKIVKEKYPDIHVVLLSSHYKDSYFGHMIELDIAAFLPKNIHISSLEEALNNVYENQVHFSSNDFDLMQNYQFPISVDHDQVERLEDIESKVLSQIAKNTDVHEIARSFEITEAQIKQIELSIMGKLNLKNKASLVIYAHQMK